MRIGIIDCSMYRAQALGTWVRLSKAPGFTFGLTFGPVGALRWRDFGAS
jgi:hypothetical protein